MREAGCHREEAKQRGGFSETQCHLYPTESSGASHVKVGELGLCIHTSDSL